MGNAQGPSFDFEPFMESLESEMCAFSDHTCKLMESLESEENPFFRETSDYSKSILGSAFDMCYQT